MPNVTRLFRLSSLAAAGLGWTLGAAAAAPALTVSGGLLTGATGLPFGAGTVDVALVDGVPQQLFGASFALTDVQTYTLAHTFLELIKASPFAYAPQLVAGCGSTFICNVFSPYEQQPALNQYNAASFSLRADQLGYVTGPTSLALSGIDTRDFPTFVMARYTVTAVPEPGAALLMLAGVGVLALRWRHLPR